VTELDAFRHEVRAFLAEAAPASLRGSATTPFQGFWGGRLSAGANPDQRLWFDRCLARGWTVPHWPRRYGGADLPLDHYQAWKEELAAQGLPLPLVGFGLTMIGPILLAEGSEAQKAQHLPRIAQGEVRWCQGYSEPGAGSDLASLRTRAVREGDDFIVNGQKTWTSHADEADWIFCLVRTDPAARKQAGISFLLIDMNSPGIRTRPIELISGSSPFCEVFFEDVRVPVAHVVGPLHDGWRVAKSLLAHERGMVGESVAAGGARAPELQNYSLAAHARDVAGVDNEGRIADPLLRDAILRCEMDQALMRLTVQRANDRLALGHPPGAETSTLKLVGTELNQRRWELAARIAGAEGLGWSGDAFGERDRALTRQWLRSRANSIEGGTSEIQRNILARSVLGLPAGPKSPRKGP